MDNTIIISHLNGLKSFQGFWSIEGSLMTLADFHVFQAHYNVTGYDDVHCSKFIHFEQLTEEEIFCIETERIPFITNPLIKGFYCDVHANSIQREAHKYAEESIRCYIEVLSNYHAYDEQIILYVLFGCTLSIISYNKDNSLLEGIIESIFNDSTIIQQGKRLALRFFYTSKYYKAIECQSIIDSNESWLKLSDDYNANQTYFNLLLKIAQAANKPVAYKNILYHRLAENEDIILSPIIVSLRYLIENKVFSYRKLITYLNKSWLGQPRIQVNAALNESNESWLDNLMPSLKILCRELSKETMRENYKGDYVCCLDSLTMKLEGCLRDIARAKGLKTMDENNNEILLDGLLKQLDESTIPHKTQLLLNAILTHEGINLRNKYAHGFSSLADYNSKNAIMLVHCLLRLSAIEL